MSVTVMIDGISGKRLAADDAKIWRTMTNDFFGLREPKTDFAHCVGDVFVGCRATAPGVILFLMRDRCSEYQEMSRPPP
jgi:hypothetical protein